MELAYYHKLEFGYSFGVESNKEDFKAPRTIEDAINHKNIRVFKDISDLMLNGYHFGNAKIGISYAIPGKALIGMDIIKELYSLIIPVNGKVYYFGAKNNIVSNSRLMEFIIKQFIKNINESEQQVLEANLLNRQINNSNQS